MKLQSIIAANAVAFGLVGCATVAPDFGVPLTKQNVPSTKSITDRIQCELIDMVRDDMPEDKRFPHWYRLNYSDYRIAAALQLDVTESGGVSPSLTFIEPLVSVGVNFTVSQSREDSLTLNLEYSLKELKQFYYKGLIDCNNLAFDTNLSGELGLKQAVRAAFTTDGLINTDKLESSAGAFSGSINFIVTKNLTGIGPDFSLTRFRGPGSLIAASQVHTHKLSYGFASGADVGKYSPVSASVRAARALDRQIQNDFGTQLLAIRNLLR